MVFFGLSSNSPKGSQTAKELSITKDVSTTKESSAIKKTEILIPAEPANLKKLIDPDVYPAFYLVQTDKQFGYLADFLIERKVKIEIEELPQCGEHEGQWGGCASGACPNSNKSLKIVVTPKIVNDAGQEYLAGLIIHELSHLQSKSKNPDYYCTEKKYLSNEFLANKNQAIFVRQYPRIVKNYSFFSDLYDSQGKVKEGTLYKKVKSDYPWLIDDMRAGK